MKVLGSNRGEYFQKLTLLETIKTVGSPDYREIERLAYESIRYNTHPISASEYEYEMMRTGRDRMGGNLVIVIVEKEAVPILKSYKDKDVDVIQQQMIDYKRKNQYPITPDECLKENKKLLLL